MPALSKRSRHRGIAAVQMNRQAPRAPIAALRFKHTGDFMTAGSATVLLEIPFAQLVPIALDEQLAATRAPCASACSVMHVSGVNVV